jgi:hypothetical protein
MDDDMDPSVAASKAMGEAVNREAADERKRSEETTDETSRESSDSGFNVRSMLGSTQPDLSPQQASGSLDFSTPWYAHAEVFFEKATNASGTPAWVHGLMALVLLLAVELDLPVPSVGSTDDGDRADEETAEADGGVGTV